MVKMDENQRSKQFSLDENNALVVSMLERISRSKRNKYAIWCVDRFREDYQKLADDMNWDVSASLKEITEELANQSTKIDPGTSRLEDLIATLPEGEDGCSRFWANGLDFLCALDMAIEAMSKTEVLPYLKLYQLSRDHLDRSLVNRIYGEVSGPHDPKQIREMNDLVHNSTEMKHESSLHEQFLESLMM